jgi:hypothetical protein
MSKINRISFIIDKQIEQLNKAVKEYVKTHMGEKGYIDTQKGCSQGRMYFYSYTGTIGGDMIEGLVKGVRVYGENIQIIGTQNFVSTNIEYSDSDFSVYDISDKILAEKVKYAIYKGFKNKDILNGVILKNIDIIKHYKNRLSKKADFDLTTGSFLGQKKIKINLNRFLAFCEDFEGKLKNALCYYSGEIDNQEDKTNRFNAPLNNKDFLNSTDTYNTFINVNLLNKIAQKISTEGIDAKTYDRTVPKKSLSYDFTALSLKKYFNGLDAYDDALEFSTSIKISEFDTKSAKFNTNFNIGENQNVFAINVELNFGLKFSLKKNVRLNLCLNNVSNIKVSISSGSVTIKDEAGLISAIQESFDFDNIPICLSDNGVSFRDYYAKIKNIEALEEGFYLFGDQLYQ